MSMHGCRSAVCGLLIGAGAVGVGAMPALAEQARRAGDFVDSIGVNTHYINSVYTGQNGYSFPALDRKLADLGVRHIRDNTDLADPPALARLDGLHTSHGIRAILVPNSTASGPAGMLALLKAHPVYEAVEGLNEPDYATRSYGGFTDNPAAKDFSATRAYQNDLYAAVKNDPATAHIKVLSAAMGNSSNAQYLNGTAFDFASMHSYPVAHSPSYNLDTHITRTNASATPPRPIWATETGYYNKPADGGQVSEAAMGKYVPRLFGEYFNRGVARTYSYELVDQNPTSDKESNFGLLRWDLSPKPAYTALKNLIGLLEPAGTAGFTPGSTDFTLTTSATRVRHTLLQRSDGSFCLLQWNDVATWSLANQRDIVNADVAVTLTLGDEFDRARVFLPNVSTEPTATYADPKTLTLSVPDQVMVVEFSNVPEPALAWGVGAVTASGLLLRQRRRGG